ncbi:hypothetical protein F5877DRAFT_86726 [Lentinula edodes]|nr:hypothetical protein F5877DRAFT_86726 [Lentinula edodes]
MRRTPLQNKGAPWGDRGGIEKVESRASRQSKNIPNASRAEGVIIPPLLMGGIRKLRNRASKWSKHVLDTRRTEGVMAPPPLVVLADSEGSIPPERGISIERSREHWEAKD